MGHFILWWWLGGSDPNAGVAQPSALGAKGHQPNPTPSGGATGSPNAPHIELLIPGRVVSGGGTVNPDPLSVASGSSLAIISGAGVAQSESIALSWPISAGPQMSGGGVGLGVLPLENAINGAASGGAQIEPAPFGFWAAFSGQTLIGGATGSAILINKIKIQDVFISGGASATSDPFPIQIQPVDAVATAGGVAGNTHLSIHGGPAVASGAAVTGTGTVLLNGQIDGIGQGGGVGSGGLTIWNQIESVSVTGGASGISSSVVVTLTPDQGTTSGGANSFPQPFDISGYADGVATGGASVTTIAASGSMSLPDPTLTAGALIGVEPLVPWLAFPGAAAEGAGFVFPIGASIVCPDPFVSGGASTTAEPIDASLVIDGVGQGGAIATLTPLHVSEALLSVTLTGGATGTATLNLDLVGTAQVSGAASVTLGVFSGTAIPTGEGQGGGTGTTGALIIGASQLAPTLTGVGIALPGPLPGPIAPSGEGQAGATAQGTLLSTWAVPMDTDATGGATGESTPAMSFSATATPQLSAGASVTPILGWMRTAFYELPIVSGASAIGGAWISMEFGRDWILTDADTEYESQELGRLWDVPADETEFCAEEFGRDWYVPELLSEWESLESGREWDARESGSALTSHEAGQIVASHEHGARWRSQESGSRFNSEE